MAAAPGPAPARRRRPRAMFQTFVPSPTRKKSITVDDKMKYRPKKTVLVARKRRENDLLDRNRMFNVASSKTQSPKYRETRASSSDPYWARPTSSSSTKCIASTAMMENPTLPHLRERGRRPTSSRSRPFLRGI